MVPYKMKFCGHCQESTEHFDDRQYAEDKEQWNCIQCFDRQDSEDALDNATSFSDMDDEEGLIYDEW
tara:strand:+ start:218 stop:418 length:201 start_codon:yes stop_codon:yes gene_type:complete